MEAWKPKALNRIAKLGYGNLCLSFNLRLQITALISSNSSHVHVFCKNTFTWFQKIRIFLHTHNSNTPGATSGTWTAYLSGAPVPLVAHELLIFPEHLWGSWHMNYLSFRSTCGVRVTHFLVYCVVFVDHCLCIFFFLYSVSFTALRLLITVASSIFSCRAFDVMPL